MPTELAQFLIAQPAVQIQDQCQVLLSSFVASANMRALIGGVRATRRGRRIQLQRLFPTHLRADQFALVSTEPEQQ